MSIPLTVTRIGHACQLIELGDARVVTDPWFTQTPVYYQGEPVVRSVGELGRVDALLISHEHYDHCDLDALVEGGFDLDVPLVGPGTVTTIAADKGFRNLTTLEAWDSCRLGELTITATPGEHAVHEVTYVIQSDSRTVFFGGDSLHTPDLDSLPERFGRFDLAILPVNGLCVRLAGMQQVVMNAEEAAQLTAVLQPSVVVAHHYAYHSGALGDRLITLGDQDPRHFADAVARLAPDVRVHLTVPGTPVVVP